MPLAPLEKVLEFEIAAGRGRRRHSDQSLLDAGIGDAGLGLSAIDALGRVSAILTGLIRKHRP